MFLAQLVVSFRLLCLKAKGCRDGFCFGGYVRRGGAWGGGGGGEICRLGVVE